jgi:predicted O-methyltransferase YrrM
MTETQDLEHWTFTRDAPVELPFGRPIPVGIRGFMWSHELVHLNLTAETLRRKGVPGGVLEVGSYCGLSASALGQPGPLTCVDTFTDSWGPTENERYTRPEFDANMRLMGLSPRVLEMDSKEALPLLRSEGERFRLILIDGGHSYKEAHPDLVNAIPLLAPGGVIVVDDANVPDVLQAAYDAGLEGTLARDRKLLFAIPKEGVCPVSP